MLKKHNKQTAIEVMIDRIDNWMDMKMFASSSTCQVTNMQELWKSEALINIKREIKKL